MSTLLTSQGRNRPPAGAPSRHRRATVGAEPQPATTSVPVRGRCAGRDRQRATSVRDGCRLSRSCTAVCAVGCSGSISVGVVLNSGRPRAGNPAAPARPQRTAATRSPSNSGRHPQKSKGRDPTLREVPSHLRADERGRRRRTPSRSERTSCRIGEGKRRALGFNASCPLPRPHSYRSRPRRSSGLGSGGR